ncbi:MAG: hypothetical protein R2939_06750 [Kofleriaceae bacterium]
MIRRALLVLGLVLATARVAEAYPQFQLDGSQACVDCHVAPAGGGLLTDFGRLFAEDLSADDGDESFLGGRWTPPDWLAMSGDVRLAVGASGRGDYGPAIAPVFIPMQAEVNASANVGAGFSLAATTGLRGGLGAGNVLSLFQVREHYVMWRPSDDGRGVYARAGRYMAPYGLRLAEHPAYTRRYAGTNLFSETYGVSVGYVGAAGEVHATGFVHDVLRDPVEPGDGAALLVEARLGGQVALGASGRTATSDLEARHQAGVHAKVFLPSVHTLVQGEVYGIRQTFEVGPDRDQVAGYLMGSHRRGAWMYSLAVGHYDEDVDVGGLDRDAVDANVHWFPWAHWEFVVTARTQLLGWGDGGPTSGYGLVQAHYRL